MSSQQVPSAYHTHSGGTIHTETHNPDLLALLRENSTASQNSPQPAVTAHYLSSTAGEASPQNPGGSDKNPDQIVLGVQDRNNSAPVSPKTPEAGGSLPVSGDIDRTPSSVKRSSSEYHNHPQPPPPVSPAPHPVSAARSISQTITREDHPEASRSGEKSGSVSPDSQFVLSETDSACPELARLVESRSGKSFVLSPATSEGGSSEEEGTEDRNDDIGDDSITPVAGSHLIHEQSRTPADQLHSDGKSGPHPPSAPGLSPAAPAASPASGSASLASLANPASRLGTAAPSPDLTHPNHQRFVTPYHSRRLKDKPVGRSSAVSAALGEEPGPRAALSIPKDQTWSAKQVARLRTGAGQDSGSGFSLGNAALEIRTPTPRSEEADPDPVDSVDFATDRNVNSTQNSPSPHPKTEPEDDEDTRQSSTPVPLEEGISDLPTPKLPAHPSLSTETSGQAPESDHLSKQDDPTRLNRSGQNSTVVTPGRPEAGPLPLMVEGGGPSPSRSPRVTASILKKPREATDGPSIHRVYVDSPTFTREEEEEYRFVSSRVDNHDEDPPPGHPTFRGLDQQAVNKMENGSAVGSRANSRPFKQVRYQDDDDRYEDREEILQYSGTAEPPRPVPRQKQFVLKAKSGSAEVSRVPQPVKSLALPSGPSYDPVEEEELAREMTYQRELKDRVDSLQLSAEDTVIPRLPLNMDSEEFQDSLDIPEDVELDSERHHHPPRDSLDVYEQQRLHQAMRDTHWDDPPTPPLLLQPQPSSFPPQRQGHAEPQRGYGDVRTQGQGYAGPQRKGDGDPQREGYANPQRQGYADLQKQGYGDPQRLGYGDPQRLGYADPQRQGYGQGYPDSQRQGYGDPQRQGYVDPQRQGYEQGYADPQRKGYADPQRQGYTDPQRQGYADSYRQGYRQEYGDPQRQGYAQEYADPQRQEFSDPENQGYPKPQGRGYVDLQREGYQNPPRQGQREPLSVFRGDPQMLGYGDFQSQGLPEAQRNGHSDLNHPGGYRDDYNGNSRAPINSFTPQVGAGQYMGEMLQRQYNNPYNHSQQPRPDPSYGQKPPIQGGYYAQETQPPAPLMGPNPVHQPLAPDTGPQGYHPGQGYADRNVPPAQQQRGYANASPRDGFYLTEPRGYSQGPTPMYRQGFEDADFGHQSAHAPHLSRSGPDDSDRYQLEDQASQSSTARDSVPPPKPEHDFVTGNKLSYGRPSKHTYRKLYAMKKEEGEKLGQLFIQPKVKGTSQKGSHNTSPSRYPTIAENPEEGDDQGAEELWAHRSASLAHAKMNGGKKKSGSNASTLSRNNSSMPASKSASAPSTTHVAPPGPQASQPYAPSRPMPARQSLQWSPPQLSPTHHQVALYPVTQQLVTEDGQRISVDVNLRLISPPVGPEVEGAARQPVGNQRLTGLQYPADNVGGGAQQLNGTLDGVDYPRGRYSADDVLSSKHLDGELAGGAESYIGDANHGHSGVGYTTNPYKKIPPIPTSSEVPRSAPVHSEGSYMMSYLREKEKMQSQGDKPWYRVYGLSDYKRMQKEVRLGTLGPDLDNNMYKEKREKMQRQTEYAKTVKDKNAKDLTTKKPPAFPRAKETDDVLSRRKLAVEYAKNVPKPTVKPRPEPYNNYEMASKLSPIAKPSKAQQLPPALQEPSMDILDLEKMHERHQQDKRSADIIRQKAQGILS